MIAIFPISCINPASSISLSVCWLRFKSSPILTAILLTFSECLFSLLSAWLRVWSIRLTVLFLMLWLSVSFFLYICSSALEKISLTGWVAFVFVSKPIDTDIIILSIFVFSIEVYILSIILEASCSDVFGRSITNSSPPILDIMSSKRHSVFKFSATLTSSSSPFLCPKASFVSLSPFTSNSAIVSGRFLSVSSLSNSSSKKCLLYSPVSWSWKLKYPIFSEK